MKTEIVFDSEGEIKIVDSHPGGAWQKGLLSASVSQKFSEGKTVAAADVAQIFWWFFHGMNFARE